MAKAKTLDLDQLRRIALTGVVSNDVLAERMVLKGGNALRLAHGVSGRASMDLDFSIAGDFAATDKVEADLFQGLRDRFDVHGLVVIDAKFSQRPAKPSEDPTWGGYKAAFKLISRQRFEQLRHDPLALSREAMIVNGPGGGSNLTIDISKFEYFNDKETITVSIDGFECRVYSLRLVVAEKLRAIVQQMPGAPPSIKKTRRPRDFYDIHLLCSGKEDILGDDFGALLNEVFAAKKAPLSLLAEIPEWRDHHEVDWPSVRDSAPGAGDDFGPYFDYVVKLAARYIPSGT